MAMLLTDDEADALAGDAPSGELLTDEQADALVFESLTPDFTAIIQGGGDGEQGFDQRPNAERERRKRIEAQIANMPPEQQDRLRRSQEAPYSPYAEGTEPGPALSTLLEFTSPISDLVDIPFKMVGEGSPPVSSVLPEPRSRGEAVARGAAGLAGLATSFVAPTGPLMAAKLGATAGKVFAEGAGFGKVLTALAKYVGGISGFTAPVAAARLAEGETDLAGAAIETVGSPVTMLVDVAKAIKVTPDNLAEMYDKGASRELITKTFQEAGPAAAIALIHGLAARQRPQRQARGFDEAEPGGPVPLTRQEMIERGLNVQAESKTPASAEVVAEVKASEVPPAGRPGVREAALPTREEVLTIEWAERWAAEHPEAADAIAAKGKPSRNDMDRAGIRFRGKRLTDAEKELLAGNLLDVRTRPEVPTAPIGQLDRQPDRLGAIENAVFPQTGQQTGQTGQEVPTPSGQGPGTTIPPAQGPAPRPLSLAEYEKKMGYDVLHGKSPSMFGKKSKERARAIMRNADSQWRALRDAAKKANRKAETAYTKKENETVRQEAVEVAKTGEQRSLLMAGEDVTVKPEAREAVKPDVPGQLQAFRTVETIDPNETGIAAASGVAPPTKGQLWGHILDLARLKRKILGAPPKDPSTPKATGGKDPVVQFTDGVKDYTILNQLGTPSNQLPKFGPLAKKASEDVFYTAIQVGRKIGARDLETNHVIKSLPKEYRKRGARAFSELLDGKTIEQIEADASLPQSVKKAARIVKEQYEADRNTMIDRLRQQRQTYYENMDETARAKVATERGLDPTAKDIVEQLTTGDIPDSWGIKGTYLPHIFPGEFKLYVGDSFVGSARTKLEALFKLADYAAENPDVDAKTVRVERRLFMDPDVLRISNRRKAHVVNKIVEGSEVTASEVRDAMRGVIGTKESRQKNFGNIKQRTGAEGWEKDFEVIQAMYNRGMVRWTELTDLNRRVEPLIQKLEKQGLTKTAQEIKNVMGSLWGVQSESSRLLDSALERVPGIRWIHRPMAMDRWLGRTMGLVSKMMLTTPRFHVVNSLQTLQTLWPVVTTREFGRGLKLWASKEGQDILTRNNVLISNPKFNEGTMLGQQREKLVSAKRVMAFVPPFASETRNQGIAYLTMWDKAKRMGMDEAQADKYATLRGQLFTQFYGVGADAPGFTRGAASKNVMGATKARSPILSAIFQFKRFPVKNIELALKLVQDRNIGGVAKWFGAQMLLGGLKVLPFAAGGGYLWYQMRKKIADDYGETATDVVNYGLPALLSLDLSRSINTVDLPFGSTIQEQIGNTVLGATGNLAVEATKAALDDSGDTQTTVPQRLGRFAIQRIPALKFVEALDAWWKEDYDLKDLHGRSVAERDLKDVLLNMGSFRSTGISNQRMLFDAMLDIKADRSDTLQKAFQAYKTNPEAADWMDGVLRWNELWPEFPITAQELMQSVRTRYIASESDLPARSLDKRQEAYYRQELEAMNK